MNDTRILYSDDGVITDLTTALAKYGSGEATIASFVAAEDAFYIGSRHPLNQFYLKMGSTVNTSSPEMSIAYWAGKSRQFFDAVEVIDETNGMAKTAYVTYVPDKDQGWNREDTSSDRNGQNIPELEAIRIYDRYWVRIKFDIDLDPNVILSFVGQKFNDDEELGSEYPDLNRQAMRDAFESGKTSWEEQQVRAADIIVKDLVSKGIIHHKNQIITREELILAAVSKNAELVYAALGDDYTDDKTRASVGYNTRLTKGIYKTDHNRNARLDIAEEKIRTGFMKR